MHLMYKCLLGDMGRVELDWDDEDVTSGIDIEVNGDDSLSYVLTHFGTFK